MKAVYLIRTTLLTGVCVGLLTGCSWMEDWPPKGSEMESKAAPKPPQSKIMQTSEGTWLQPDKQAKTVESAPAKGLNVDPASADRIAQLEKSVSDLRSDLNMMMPALTKIAEAQGDIKKSLGQIEPAAGGMAPVQDASGFVPQAAAQQQAPMPLAQAPSPSQPSMQDNGPTPGSVAWYEEQERIHRQQEQQQAQQMAMAQPAAPPPAAYAPPPQAPSVPPAAAYQQPPAQYNQAYQQPAPPQQAPAYQQNYQPAAYQQPAAYTPPPAAQPMAQPASYSGGSFVSAVRFGEHPDKTRVVFDTSDKVSFSYDLDNKEHILMIDMPGTSWQGATQNGMTGSPLVQSYNVIPGPNGGSQIVMQLKQPVSVLWAQALPPGGQQGNRVVFDIAPL